jgi:hypothetical protein
MIRYAYFLCVLLVVSSCKKKTECHGIVYDKFGQPTPGIEIFLGDSWGQREFARYLIATTNSEGYYYFAFKEKLKHQYHVICDEALNSSRSLEEGKVNSKDFYLR